VNDHRATKAIPPHDCPNGPPEARAARGRATEKLLDLAIRIRGYRRGQPIDMSSLAEAARHRIDRLGQNPESDRRNLRIVAAVCLAALWEMAE
jgi:hypothetical protein